VRWRFALGIALLFLAAAAESGARAHSGKGSFPQWRAFTLPTAVPLVWIAALPRRLAAIDREGTFWLLELSDSGVKVAGRYGEVGSPDGPPVALRLGNGVVGAAFVSREGRLLLWRDGSLREADLGTPLSPLTAPSPVDLGRPGTHELIAVGKDGGLLLIGGLPTAPRIVAHVAVHALPDARIAIGDLDRDGVPEAVILTDPTGRYSHGVLGDHLEAGSVTAVEVRPFGLDVKGRYSLPSTAVFEDLSPILADIVGDGRPAVLLVKSYLKRGATVAAFAWEKDRFVPVAEAPAIGRPKRWSHLVGVADLDNDTVLEVLTVQTPHIGGVLKAYRRKDGTLVPVARARGFSSHAVGSRNLEQAVIADLDGNGRPEVILPRGRDALAALELVEGEFAERWAYRLRGPIASNLVVADLDGDGLLDLAVADTKELHVLLSAH
jgi:hypothetical protein